MADQKAEETLVKQLSGLKVTEEERASVFKLKEEEIDRSEKKLENALVCKILSQKQINPEMFKSKMSHIWNQEQTIISMVGFNLYLCKFKNGKIKSLIADNGPWFFDKALLLFKEPKGGNYGDDIEFRYVSFWIHFHKLPFACFSREVAAEIGSILGQVCQIDLEEEVDQCRGGTLRVKIQIDATKPLKRGIFLSSEDSTEDRWIPITYEKLPDFCYGCGLLGHTLKECEGSNHDGSPVEELPYGAWLREPVLLKAREYEPLPRSIFNQAGRGRG